MAPVRVVVPRVLGRACCKRRPMKDCRPSVNSGLSSLGSTDASCCSLRSSLMGRTCAAQASVGMASLESLKTRMYGRCTGWELVERTRANVDDFSPLVRVPLERFEESVNCTTRSARAWFELCAHDAVVRVGVLHAC
eukprot:239041-Prorocentrum_minimum.AAC.3